MARILLVEDDDGLQRFLREVLEQEGHAVDCVDTKARAEAALRASSYDLTLADVRLPDGSGHDVAVLTSAAGIPTLLMSGYPDEVTQLQASGIEHLKKPFRIGDLIVVVRRLLAS